MLRNAIESYLDSVKRERELDGPILALLAGMGFQDIHFTHGINEFGKDFIAKLHESGVITQYAFQAKVGDMGSPAWRAVKPQLIEATINNLAHPGFDALLERRVVLITNGRLVGNAPIDAQETNRHLRAKLSANEIIVWDRETLADLFTRFGPERVHATKGREDVEKYGQFFKLYGDALAGRLSERQVEVYSQCWLDTQLSADERVVLAVIESTLLSSACSEQGLDYVAMHCVLATYRAVALQLFVSSANKPSYLKTLARAVLIELQAKSLHLGQRFLDIEEKVDGISGILEITSPVSPIVAYPVNCAHAMEALGLLYTLADNADRAEYASKLELLVKREPGCSHPISDYYAVSFVIAARVLADSGRTESALTLCRDIAVWLGDRYANAGSGLATMDVDEIEEVRSLLGFSFDKLEVQRQNSSFIVTALLDCVCYIGDAQLYSDIIHDNEVVDAVPTYYQPQDSIGQFWVEGEDVVRFPNIAFVEPMSPFVDLKHGEHLNGEPRKFKLESTVGQSGFVAISLLLRDRYFPTTWVTGLGESPIGLLSRS